MTTEVPATPSQGSPDITAPGSTPQDPPPADAGRPGTPGGAPDGTGRTDTAPAASDRAARDHGPRDHGHTGPEAPRRSDATRAAILEAARERFAADGYERATIRAIARDAGIDPSMVMRYYGNKEGLFTAASEIDLRLPRLGALPTQHVGAALVGHFLDRWEADDVLTAVLRGGITNPAGAERMHAIFREQLGPLVTGLCPDPAEAPRRAALVASQILGMALVRYVVKLPPASDLTRDEVVAWLAPTVQRYLTAERP